MAKKETSSDKIKKLLTQIGGQEEDWKRASKKKNDAGEWVREFENARLGLKASVIEKASGEFEIVPQKTAKPDFSRAAAPVSAEDNEKIYAKIPAALARRFGGLPEEWTQVSRVMNKQDQPVLDFKHSGGNHYVRLLHLEGHNFYMKAVEQRGALIIETEGRHDFYEPTEAERQQWRQQYEEEAQREAAVRGKTGQQLLSTPPVETDAAKNKAADEIIARILECEEVSESKLKKAGKALANRFAFGIGYNDDDYRGVEGECYLAIAPLEDTCYDQHVESYIEHLLPEGISEECEASFSYSGKLTLMELAEDLMRRGFVLDRGMQQQMDGQQKKPLWPELKALYDKVHGIAPPPNKPGTDAPKL